MSVTTLWFNPGEMGKHHPSTVRRARRLARLLGALVGLVVGILYAAYVIPRSDGLFGHHTGLALGALLVTGAIGLVSGFLAGPLLSVEPFLWLERTVDTVSAGELAGGVVGLLVALGVSALIAVILAGLPGGLGLLISAGLAAVLVYVGVGTGMRRHGELLSWVTRRPDPPAAPAPAAMARVDAPPPPLAGAPALVDTSVLVDGRITDLARAGFLPARLLIPGFVLEELQRIADSGDPVRRAKGRRGLAVVEGLRGSTDVSCEVVDRDFPGTPEVDARLVRLARALDASVMTTDHNLTTVARIEGVRVLNLNDLAVAMRPVLAAGESLEVTIIKEGRELHQGVGYLDDGTMVVVENGRSHLEESVRVTVTSVLQTPSGRMIFATTRVDAAAAPRRARPPRAPRAAER
ncbi:MAG TPA: TRAM domain-containing protein [Candidatus Dormibacteraeota bacterium]|nr:TRAM domain-containing protein [Candidatus Dormibacteraeota bacterium]